MAGQYEKTITIKQTIDSINLPLSSTTYQSEVRLEQQSKYVCCLIPSMQELPDKLFHDVGYP